MLKSTKSDLPVHAAALSAAALIAHQVGGKAVRDALFLSQFDVERLAWMVIAASVLSILAGVAGAKLMASIPPAKVVPRAFLASAVLLLIEWAISSWSNAVVAVLVYLQIAALGSALISGFWSLLGDRFDPHAARKQFTKVVAASTFGGMIGGLLAERVGTTLGVAAMLPVLAALDLICAFLTTGLGRSTIATVFERRQSRESKSRTGTDRGYSGFRVLRNEPYLRDLAILVMVTTIGAGLLDYAFKARAAAAYSGGADLVRYFAIFYTVIGVITFLVQIAFSRPSLEKLGLAGTIGSLPVAVAVGGVGGVLVPGLGVSAAARGGEAALRSSLFRSGYELFFAAVPASHRRRIKPILDVGFERIADILGGVLISVLLLTGPNFDIPLILALAALTGVVGLFISRRLHHGYVKALETNLLNQSIHIDISDIRDSTTRAAVMQTLSNPVRFAKQRPQLTVAAPPTAADAVVKRVADLRSTDPEVVRRALAGPLDATIASHVIPLLAWNAVADDAVHAVQAIAPGITGQLIDALLDPAQAFAVRRRIPRVLSVCDSRRAFDGLAQGLFDDRFEVRFQSGRAMAQIQDRVRDIPVDQSLITNAVLRELSVDKEVWDTRSVIDGTEYEIANVSSEHVFRLLSLILPRDPLKIAYRGLYSGDDRMKGMALEYLESVLPPEVRSVLTR
jgi:ATP:ADP antiporter, AAA family